LIPQSTASSIYQDMVVNQLADNISQSGTFGLAQSLKQQLVHQLKPSP
jgi:Rod binding domain-containing protein